MLSFPIRPSAQIALLAAGVFGLGALALAGPDDLRGLLQRPAKASGTVVVPDRFVRPWDPVTVFFQWGAGPANGGPEDHADRLVKLNPDQPGAWTWLDGRTLQFQPAEPWPALGTFTVDVGGRTTELLALMTPPIGSVPADGREGLDPVSSIVLTFRDPLPVDALRRMTTIELRPLPGVGDGKPVVLTADDFEIKELAAVVVGEPPQDQGSTDTGYVAYAEYDDTPAPPTSADGRSYELRLAHPIPGGTRATVRFRLADDPGADAFAKVSFATREPFRIARAGCASVQLPLPRDGARYTKDEALACTDGSRTIAIDFTAPPASFGPVEAKNLVQFEPAVDGLNFAVYGTRLEISGSFVADTPYHVHLGTPAVQDTDGRGLDVGGPSDLYAYFPARSQYLRVTTGDAVIEKSGPKSLPLEGRGETHADVRLYKIDGFDRSFWPFPSSPLPVDETIRPPGPGEVPAPWTTSGGPSTSDLATYIRTLGSPAVSRIVDLPLRTDRAAASFGLDLAPLLAGVSADQTPGTWLVGVRPLDGGSERQYARVQITDLSLTAVEEEGGVRFLVTSLATANPVGGAKIRIEGYSHGDWGTLDQGTTSANGQFAWKAPGGDEYDPRSVARIVVEKGDDRLVLDPNRAPAVYRDGYWSDGSDTWLQWAFQDLRVRAPSPDTLCHMFTERPVYRPEEDVHIEGWLRRRDRGVLSTLGGVAGDVVVHGPGNAEWTEPVVTTASGGFYWKFHADNPPTGNYNATFQPRGGGVPCAVPFDVEAYRIPTFKADLAAADTVPADRPFEVGATASYYAGGPVARRPVRWRVTQFPLTWGPAAREGFVFSSDGRFSGQRRFDSTGRYEQDGKTDDTGHATITLDPAIEPTAQPRTYVIEATVTGDDDQTVTTVRKVDAVPAFVVGMKLPRYVEHATVIAPEVLVVGPDGKALAGQDVTVRLLHREWHSRLQASDFSDGKARYVTDVVDVPIKELSLQSGADATVVTLPVAASGVYLVEAEARDRLGRTQVVSVDMYVGGDTAVTWPKAQAGTFELGPDKTRYEPGDTANIVVKSPYQTAEGLLIVETPSGNKYTRIAVKGGQATVAVPISDDEVPRLPVHVVLFRGRTETPSAQATDADLGKPVTVASTVWLEVAPVENEVTVTIDAPDRATPGETVPVTLHLRDDDGKPVSGEAALWLVDAAVLALGKERRLDPLPDYLTDVASRLTLRDTRNSVLGRLPFAEMPGGDGGDDEEADVPPPTVRKDFKSVPYYEPALQVPATGDLTVNIKLPDNLTVFKVRAKVASGAKRFGAGTDEIAVRLPVLVQPILPRFARPGDAFVAGAMARVIEGDGGPGTAKITVDGVDLAAADKQSIVWDPIVTAHIGFPVVVPTPKRDANGRISRDHIDVTIRATRAKDGVGDAFMVTLPLEEDDSEVVLAKTVTVKPGETVKFDAIGEPTRAGTVTRSFVASDLPEIARMAGALSFFERYPYGSTEQRVSKARAYMAVGTLYTALHRDDAKAHTDRAVDDGLAWLPRVVDADGLVADWPGTPGSVSRTAWALEFLSEATAAGYTVDRGLESTLADTLRRALRSDYGHFVDGESWDERVLALAALTDSGRYDAGWWNELSRQTRYMDSEGVAGVVLAGSRSGSATEAPTLSRLVGTLSTAVLTKLWQGNEVYAGLTSHARSPRILPSETRSAARILRAMEAADPSQAKIGLLTDALVTLGGDDGWGTTNANAEAMFALAGRLAGDPPGEAYGVTVTQGPTPSSARSTGRVAALNTSSADAGTFTSTASVPLTLRVETRYLPAEDASHANPVANGLVVSRELLRIHATGPADRVPLDAGGGVFRATVGDVVEEHVRLIVPETRYDVALRVPLAAGMEPLNPALATAPPEAHPANASTVSPTYTAWRDDEVTYYYDTLAKGTYDIYYREKAQTVGAFVQPPAHAGLEYDLSVWGRSAGVKVVVE